MLEVRTDRLIPLTQARQEIGKILNLIKGGDYYILTDAGTPKAALVDVDYLGYLKQIEKQVSWQKRFEETINYFSKKAASFSSAEIKKDIAKTIEQVRRAKTKNRS